MTGMGWSIIGGEAVTEHYITSEKGGRSNVHYSKLRGVGGCQILEQKVPSNV